MKNIYTMQLHDTITIDYNGNCMPYTTVFRVAGGWIYSYRCTQPIFVPFNNEFADYISELHESNKDAF